MDELFDILLRQPGASSLSVEAKTHSAVLQQYHVPSALWNRTIAHPINAFFTRDYNSNTRYPPHEMPPPAKVQVQGGFLVLRPSPGVFEDFVELIREGDFGPFRGWGSGGWGGIRKGSGGRDRFQGLVSYYYSGLYPFSAVELNPCMYNQNAGEPWNTYSSTMAEQKTRIDGVQKAIIFPLPNSRIVVRPPWKRLFRHTLVGVSSLGNALLSKEGNIGSHVKRRALSSITNGMRYETIGKNRSNTQPRHQVIESASHQWTHRISQVITWDTAGRIPSPNMATSTFHCHYDYVMILLLWPHFKISTLVHSESFSGLQIRTGDYTTIFLVVVYRRLPHRSRDRNNHTV
jgi:hypothetical protein